MDQEERNGSADHFCIGLRLLALTTLVLAHILSPVLYSHSSLYLFPLFQPYFHPEACLIRLDCLRSN
jgi:hypothetical protein